MNSSNSTEHLAPELNLYYVTSEVLVGLFAVVGNALVIFVFSKERRLRRRTNYYIVSLAAADFLVGLLGIPFAIMASVGLPKNLYACMFTVSLLVVLCTISIFCLVAVSVDRYWAILYPMGYSRNVRTKTALVIISICWFAGTIVGFLPLLGWHKEAPLHGECYFLAVMDYNYLVFLYFGTIITPAIILAGFYAHIYQVVIKQLRQIVTMHPENSSSRSSSSASGGTMVRMLGVAQTNEVKATQNLAIIVLFFMICWIPLYTVNCVIAFTTRPDFKVDETFMFSCIILSHLNSAGNPLLYAYHLRDFRSALKNFFCNLFGQTQYCDDLNRTRPPSGVHHNYNQNRFRKDSRINALNFNAIPATRINTIVKNSAVVAVATTGENHRNIWNIPEDSGSSNESIKPSNEKDLMIRPATPYRSQKNISSFLEVEHEAEDVFNEDTLPYHDYSFDNFEFETCLNDSVFRTVKVFQVDGNCKSSSSPQLSRGLFLVEREAKQPTRSFSLVEDRSNGRGISSLKMPRLFQGGKKTLSKSLSDEGNVSMESLAVDGKVIVTS